VVFKNLKTSVLLVCLALLGLAALPAYPLTETASIKLSPADAKSTPTLLGESPSSARSAPTKRVSTQDDSGGGTMTLSVPKLGLEDVPVPTGDSQVELDREGILHLKGTGAPWEEGSNTVIVGHALGYLWTRTTYVFYQLDQLKPGDEILIKDQQDKTYTFKVYDRMTVRPEDYWITYPVPDKTIVSLQSCTPIPTFENRLIVRGELES
jgi:sortase A